MSKILVSGLVNLETTCSVSGFPIEYAPIDYRFFGVNSAVSGVGYNVSKALAALGNSVDTATMLGKDSAGDLALDALKNCGINCAHAVRCMEQTPASVVLYDGDGRRRIYCDLKDIQERSYDFGGVDVSEYDAAAVCNINFSRPLLHKAKQAGIPVATDVHVLSSIDDEYNREFMECADILFLSDEGLPCEPRNFLMQIEQRYGNKIIILGQGGNGALMYLRDEGKFYDFSAVRVGEIINTVGAGDSLFSAFVSLYVEGMHPIECLKRAEIFASNKICSNGASNGFVSRNELEKLYCGFGGGIAVNDNLS